MFARALLKSIRDYQRHAGRPGLVHVLLRKYARARHLFWSVMTASDIDPRARLGANVRLPHPNGLVFHENARVGDDCMIMQQVTLGMIGAGEYPVIGNRVYIGAGAKVLGKVHVGDGARIGAMAVVLEDVPADCTAVGIPARIIRRQEREMHERGSSVPPTGMALEPHQSTTPCLISPECPAFSDG
ncbi:serine acetyltransferase [Ramlibacter ginsenosidimutans]|uniref:Serine acetyltransferase n=1 Tax=Ramlibacter ginsenosidimutans TaxID=502333 RepID=A0A934WK08_9BURK|nr:serine O-acetyltransferase [Ramlibacter ginsenosidimutans]MBK6005224.1 serine acetyltransferase [Ramlibacter ginsenosidimutans]